MIGATVTADGVRFRVWAPRAKDVALVLGDRRLAMTAQDRGGFELIVPEAGVGDRYGFSLDGGAPLPDPASRWQPDGVHALSAVAATPSWSVHDWPTRSLGEHVLYELHIGTFTAHGTFDSAIERLDDLVELGVTAIELMPIAEFPGGRNWGYDGVLPFAAQSTYGGPAGLARLVDAAHARGLSVVLDVVYNHMGPEGNRLSEFGPYFTDRYATPWGGALNYDGPGSDAVREYFIENALFWIDDMRLDGLRLDAVHEIRDAGPLPFVTELTTAVHERAAALGRDVLVIAESAANDPRVVRAVEAGGQGCDAAWNDDFHHALRTVLTGEREGYYGAYGQLDQLAKAYSHGYVFTGEYSSTHERRHGAPTTGLADSSFVVFSQNHDQIGNRMHGDRLCRSVDFERAKLAAAAVLLSPFTPMLFMGEEHASSSPFHYFISHTDEALVQAVRDGRASEFDWQGDPPDPQSADLFCQCVVDWSEADDGRGAVMRSLYQRLIELRSTLGLGTAEDRDSRKVDLDVSSRVLTVHRRLPCGRAAIVLCMGPEPAETGGLNGLTCLLNTADKAFGGPGGSALAPWSARLYAEGH